MTGPSIIANSLRSVGSAYLHWQRHMLAQKRAPISRARARWSVLAGMVGGVAAAAGAGVVLGPALGSAPRPAAGPPTCPRTIWEVSPGVSDESSFGRGYSSPKLMPSALASRTRSLWGSTYLSLPATSSSGMWHILPSRRAIM